jgi:hypothetical protein
VPFEWNATASDVTERVRARWTIDARGCPQFSFLIQNGPSPPAS